MIPVRIHSYSGVSCVGIFVNVPLVRLLASSLLSCSISEYEPVLFYFEYKLT